MDETMAPGGATYLDFFLSARFAPQFSAPWVIVRARRRRFGRGLHIYIKGIRRLRPSYAEGNRITIERTRPSDKYDESSPTAFQESLSQNRVSEPLKMRLAAKPNPNRLYLDWAEHTPIAASFAAFCLQSLEINRSMRDAKQPKVCRINEEARRPVAQRR